MSLIETSIHGAIHELRLARPPVNALNPELCEALSQALEDAVAAGAQGIVLAGGPKVFSAGLDVPYLLSLGDDQEALLAAWTVFFKAARALVACPVPVVAALAGHSPAGECPASAATTGTGHAASARAASKNSVHDRNRASWSLPNESR